MQINFTGKNQLTNDEFIDFYDELWKRTPHYTINWPSNDEISRMKTDGSKIYNSDDKGKTSLINRIEGKKGTHILEATEELGLGSRKYELIDIDKE